MRIGGCIVSIVVGVLACGGTDVGLPAASDTTGDAGVETSPCLDGMCEAGLVCLSNLCVDPNTKDPATVTGPDESGTSAPMTSTAPTTIAPRPARHRAPVTSPNADYEQSVRVYGFHAY